MFGGPLVKIISNLPQDRGGKPRNHLFRDGQRSCDKVDLFRVFYMNIYRMVANLKKPLVLLFLLAFLIPSFAQATLITIGTATYNDSDYNLIWDDDNNGNSVIWFDYTKIADTLVNQMAWTDSLDDLLTYNIETQYSVTWESDWRLGNTVDGVYVHGYEGDPDNDGVYSYTAGYNLANSEMGHLFYEELGNLGHWNTDGSLNTFPPFPYFLQQTGDFDNLRAVPFWSGTEFTAEPSDAWYFNMVSGGQYHNDKDWLGYGLALRSGQISYSGVDPVPGPDPVPAPVPEPTTILLFGVGLVGVAGATRKKRKK